MKTCSKCGQAKDLNMFYKNRSAKDGYACQCKSCAGSSADRSRKWRELNAEQFKAQKQRWNKENREKVNEYQRGWADKNMEKVQIYTKRWYKKNSIKAKESSRKWQAANIEKVKLLRIKFHKTNPSKSKEYNKTRVANLKGGYVLHLLTQSSSNLDKSNIPQSLINLKRIQLLINRELKKDEHENR